MHSDDLAAIETVVDAHHSSHPALQYCREAIHSLVLSAFTALSRRLLLDIEAIAPDLERWTNAYCRALSWAAATQSSSTNEPNDEHLRDALDLLGLADRYEQISTVFVAAHQGWPVSVEPSSNEIVAGLPARLRQFNAAALQHHQVPVDADLTRALNAMQLEILAETTGRPFHCQPAKWRTMLDIAERVLAPDWETDIAGDMGRGFSFETFKRVSLTLRQLSALHLPSADYIRAPRHGLAEWIANRADVAVVEATNIIDDLLFDPDLPYSTPLVLSREIVCWVPLHVFALHHEREFWVRTRLRGSAVHDRWSNARAAVPVRKIVQIVRQFGALRCVEGIKIAGRDLDIAVIDEEQHTLLCIEAKNMQSPRSFNDYLRADGRVSRDGRKLTDGLLKGARVQLPAITAAIRQDITGFLRGRLSVSAAQAAKDWSVGAAVVSNWTLGTGAADTRDGEDIPLLNVPIFEEALRLAGGHLDAALRWIRERRYLTAAPPQAAAVEYAGYRFRVNWTD